MLSCCKSTPPTPGLGQWQAIIPALIGAASDAYGQKQAASVQKIQAESAARIAKIQADAQAKAAAASAAFMAPPVARAPDLSPLSLGLMIGGGALLLVVLLLPSKGAK